MSPRTPMRRAMAALALGLACTAAQARGPEVPYNPPPIQDLAQIQQAAAAFVAAQNQQAGTRWVAGEPNNKVLVPRCAKALGVQWAPKSQGLSSQSVAVRCPRTAGGWTQHWEVFVSVRQAAH
ncbi:hypothetical protein [Cupriavidus basilensis]|uniref:hypothetical protein n=1 Tax=Cupriavidus basilensis TaxID=68895 RepID=UPI0028499D4D|nr:hypothetical protein [Cupriavidus basilensis]MDR3385022.1 hypothetical protein [Cupriavidus basilensis]